MHSEGGYVLIAAMDVEAAYEDLFNEMYDSEHVPFLLKVPGVRSAMPMKGVPFALALADGLKDMPIADPLYTAIYEIDRSDVLKSAEWTRAVAVVGGTRMCVNTYGNTHFSV